MGTLGFIDDHGAVVDLKTFKRTGMRGVAILRNWHGESDHRRRGLVVKTNDGQESVLIGAVSG